MSYQPPPQKLIQLGFWQIPRYKRFQAWNFQRPFPNAIGTMRTVHLYEDGYIRLRDFRKGQRVVFDGRCPNEAFFDELLRAVDWTT